MQFLHHKYLIPFYSECEFLQNKDVVTVCWNFGVRLTWRVNAAFGNGFILVYIVAIFIVIPHSFVTLTTTNLSAHISIS